MPGKKFLLLNSYTYPDSSGSGINAYNFAEALNQQKQNAKVLSFKRSFQTKKDSLVIRIPYFSKTFVGKLFSLPIIILYYFILIPNTNVLVVYGNKIIAWEAAVILAKIFRTKIVFQSLLPGVDDIKTIIQVSGVRRRIYQKLLNSIDCYHAINEFFSESWLEIMQKPQILFKSPQGVDHNKFLPAKSPEEKKTIRQNLNIDTDSYILLSSGFLIERKGYSEVFKSLANLNLNFRYIHVGDYKFGGNHFLQKKNNEASALYEKAKINLGKKGEFKGFVSNINEYFKSADVFIHGKAIEGFPNAFLEAMSAGVPIVTSPIKGLTDKIIKDQENCLIYRNEHELITILIELQRNKELRKKIANNARDFILSNASFSVVIKNLEAFLF